jgi:6-phosphogluconolactonase
LRERSCLSQATRKKSNRLHATIAPQLRPKDHAGFIPSWQCDNKAGPRVPWTGAGKLEMAGVVLKFRVDRIRTLAGGAALALLLALTGCGGFFQCEGKSDCPASSSSGTGTGSDYVYISNSASGSTDINGFQISSGALTATTGSPYSLGYTPVAMAITPSDSYLYISSGTAIMGYSIGTGGALTILNTGTSNGTTLVAENCGAIAISPDGQWLFSLNTNDLTIEEYSIASGTGLLSTAANYQITNSFSGAILSSAIQVAPSGQFVAVALGTAGTEIFSFNTSTGAAAYASQVSAASSSSGDFALSIDSGNNLYVAATNDLFKYSVTSSGIPTQVSISSTGTGPYSVALDGTTYVYTGSENASSSPIISGFTISTSNPMAQVSGSPNAATTDIAAMGVDKTSAYLVTAGYNASTGVQLFSIGSTGALTSVATAATGTSTSVPTVMALTH